MVPSYIVSSPTSIPIILSTSLPHYIPVTPLALPSPLYLPFSSSLFTFNHLNSFLLHRCHSQHLPSSCTHQLHFPYNSRKIKSFRSIVNFITSITPPSIFHDVVNSIHHSPVQFLTPKFTYLCQPFLYCDYSVDFFSLLSHTLAAHHSLCPYRN